MPNDTKLLLMKIPVGAKVILDNPNHNIIYSITVKGGLKKVIKRFNHKMHFECEYKILSHLHRFPPHENILLNISTNFSLKSLTFLEMDGDLTRVQIATESHRTIFKQIAEGIQHIHACSVIHGDLKAENILINVATNQIKIIDFGLSTIARPDNLFDYDSAALWFRSPEAARGDPWGFPVDYWGFGQIIWHVLTGWPMHQPKDVAELVICCEKPRSFTFLGNGMDMYLLNRLFEVDPNKRLDVNEFLQKF